MGEAKPTQGPLVPQDREKVVSIPLKAIDCERLGFQVCLVNGHREREAKANAILIFETFQVHNTTGLTPSQLVERVKELEEALRNLDDYVCNNLSSDYPTGVDVNGEHFLNARFVIDKARPNTAEGEAK